jgi:catechol 2,3-dioxygenase-like lactoylglutathione lyase family enzyme
MFADREVWAVVPASDIERAREFYRDKLGLEPKRDMRGALMYEAKGSKFLLYETQFAGTAQNTAMSWVTDDLEADMAELRSRGVTFEDYDLPGLKTENGVASDDDGRGAWFKDSEGNILALSEGM